MQKAMKSEGTFGSRSTRGPKLLRQLQDETMTIRIRPDFDWRKETA
jgi:hypothetical protein